MKKCLAILSLALLPLISFFGFAAEKAPKPNIILIVADDMGWSDIGSYGGEIPTPNLDRLANKGIRFTQFYNSSRCYPTRASLMTGLHPHQTGIGYASNSPNGIDGDRGTFGYRGYLNRNSVTIAEALKTVGYNTYITGKWHLGYHTPDRWPLQRGFDRFYGNIAGASSYFKPDGLRGIMLDNQALPAPQGDYYTTDAFTDYAIKFIDEQKNDDPFFLYLAYTAPHWPLHAKEKDIQKFVGQYKDIGWDKLREQRYQRMVDIGIIPKGTGLSPRENRARAWDKLNNKQKKDLDYRMAVYAAQVYSMDENIGRLTDYLKTSNQFDNTLILFMSDNGGCAEPYKERGGQKMARINDPNFSGMVSYGLGWANASNTPFRKFKKYQNEGGISTPLIAHWPKGIKKMQGKLFHKTAYTPDLMPTFLELAGAQYPEKYNGYQITPVEGKSMVNAFTKGEHVEHEWMYWEHQGHRAIRNGDWKALMEVELQTWALYNIKTDRNELNDLSKQNPERLKNMVAEWYKWANRAHVLPVPPKLNLPRAKAITWPSYTEKNPKSPK